jgi:hypothetical protein
VAGDEHGDTREFARCLSPSPGLIGHNQWRPFRFASSI